MSGSRRPRPGLLIVWHSQTGACEQAAAALAKAASASEIDVRLLHADEADAAAVLDCHCVVVVAAENLAALSGRIKDFFDRSYYPLLGRTAGMPYASVICAGSDGEGAQRQLDRIATGLRWRRVAEPLRLMLQASDAEAILAPKTLSAEQLEACRELGATLSAGLALQIF